MNLIKPRIPDACSVGQFDAPRIQIPDSICQRKTDGRKGPTTITATESVARRSEHGGPSFDFINFDKLIEKTCEILGTKSKDYTMKTKKELNKLSKPELLKRVLEYIEKYQEANVNMLKQNQQLLTLEMQVKTAVRDDKVLRTQIAHLSGEISGLKSAITIMSGSK